MFSADQLHWHVHLQCSRVTTMIQLSDDKLNCGHLAIYSIFPHPQFSCLGFVILLCSFFFPSVLFRAHFTCSLSASISSPSSSIPHQILLQAQFFYPGFNYRLPSVKKLSFEAPATITVGSSLNVWLFWCVLLSRKKWYIYFLNGYKQEVISVSFFFFFFLAEFFSFSADKILFNVSKQR